MKQLIWIIPVVAAYAASTVIFAAVIVSLLTPGKFEPLDYGVQHVVNPVLHPGDKLIVETDNKCNTGNQPIAVTPGPDDPIYRNLDTQALTPRSDARPLQTAIRDVGCPFLRFENAIPASLPPGRYWLEGTDTAYQGTQLQRESWKTEPFCLTDAEGKGC